MKRGGPAHPKTLHFMAATGASRPSTVGYLELLWHFVRDYAPRGDIGRMTDEQIAVACGWEDTPKTFTVAMVDAGYLDRSESHRLVVHDWSEHADDGVHALLARRVECFADGKAPKLNKLNQEERKRLEPLWKAHLSRKTCPCRARDRRKSVREAVAVPSPVIPTPLSLPLAPPSNPLVDRTALVAEGYELIRTIAPMVDMDPTEVARKATEYNGRSYVRLDTLRDDRLAHSVAELRSWLRRIRGEPEPVIPKAPPQQPRDHARDTIGQWLQKSEDADAQGAVRGRLAPPDEGARNLRDGRANAGLLGGTPTVDTRPVGACRNGESRGVGGQEASDDGRAAGARAEQDRSRAHPPGAANGRVGQGASGVPTSSGRVGGGVRGSPGEAARDDASRGGGTGHA